MNLDLWKRVLFISLAPDESLGFVWTTEEGTVLGAHSKDKDYLAKGFWAIEPAWPGSAKSKPRPDQSV